MSQKQQGDRFQTTDVFVLSGGHAVYDSYSGFLPPLLPVFIQNMPLTRTEAGMLMAPVMAPLSGIRSQRGSDVRRCSVGIENT